MFPETSQGQVRCQTGEDQGQVQRSVDAMCRSRTVKDVRDCHQDHRMVRGRSGTGQGQVRVRSGAGQGLVRDTSRTAKGLVRGKSGAGWEVKNCQGKVRDCKGRQGRGCKVRGKAWGRAKLKDDCSGVGDLPFFVLVSD